MQYVFDWDPDKAESNLPKHGISFEEGSTVFGDPLSLLMKYPDHSLDEERIYCSAFQFAKGCWWWHSRRGQH